MVKRSSKSKNFKAIRMGWKKRTKGGAVVHSLNEVISKVRPTIQYRAMIFGDSSFRYAAYLNPYLGT